MYINDFVCRCSVGFDKKLIYHKTFFSKKTELYKRFKLNGVKIVKLYLTSLLLSLRKMERKENKQIFVIGYMLNWFQRAIRDVVSTILNPKSQMFPIVTIKIWPFFQFNFERLILIVFQISWFWILNWWNHVMNKISGLLRIYEHWALHTQPYLSNFWGAVCTTDYGRPMKPFFIEIEN